jgi:hypothetical protein
MLSLITSIAYHTYVYSSGRDTVTCSNVVAGSNQNVRSQETNCGPVETEKSAFNAAGDKADWGNVSTTRKNAEKWGKISKNESHTLRFPKAGEKRMISLSLTDGMLKNKDVELLIISFDKRIAINHPEAPDAVQKQFEKLRNSTQFNSMIKIYKKTSTESLWTDLYEIFSEEYPNSKKLDVKVSVSPAGIIKTEQTIKETDTDGEKHDIRPFDINLAAFE